MAAKIKRLTNQDETHYVYCFYCPGCKREHPFNERWIFNGDYEEPTFSPSLLCNEHRPEMRCHCFVTKGKIRYLKDCFHDLAGKEVDMVDVDKADM